MWIMGYNYDGVEFNNINQDPFNGRNTLRPLIPRTTCTNPPPCFHGTDLLTLNHHLADQNKRELNCTQQVVVSSRWNPTPEQLQTLEELYRRGTRTPSADQIQHITAQLRRYGKIEGKNVFYWFQNHKARERQKRRRQLHSDESPHKNNTQTQHGEKKESSPEENGTVIYEVEQSKNWASPTNSSTILAENNVATQAAAAAACKQDGWLQFDQAGHRRDATWQMMHLSNCSSSPAAANHLIISSSPPPPPATEPYILDSFNHSAANAAAQTLQLFPLGSGGCDYDKEEEGESGGGAMNVAMIGDITLPYQFFEFLPLKK